MKEILLKKYRTAFTKDLLLAATKTPVRECDETTPGEYVAYVDEGNDSWDVSVTVDREKGIVKAHSCECNDKAAICKHRVALIAHIAEGLQTTVVKKAAKAPKRDLLANLVEETPADALRAWVLTVLRRNKDLQLAFTHQFAATADNYTPADATTMVTDVVKSVLGKKKKADAGQLKKMVELWSDILKPLISFYHNAVMDEQAFLVFDSLIESCQKVALASDSTSTRVQKYIEDILASTVATIDGLQDEALWQKAAGYFVARVVTTQNTLNGAYLHLLNALLEVSTEGRRHVMATMLMKDADAHIKTITAPGKYQHFLLQAILKADVFGLFYRQLKPVIYENAYNIALIQALIDNEELDVADEYCNRVIATNYYAEFNTPYWLLQRELYTRMGARTKLISVLTSLLPQTWSFDDFITVYNHLDDDQQQGWKRRMVAQATKLVPSNNRLAIRFLFDMLAWEGSYLKMLLALDSRTPFDVLVKYFDDLVRQNKKELLPRILSKSSEYGWGAPEQHEKEDKEQFPILFDLIRENYTDQELSTAMKTLSVVRKWRTAFFIYVEDRLSGVA